MTTMVKSDTLTRNFELILKNYQRAIQEESCGKSSSIWAYFTELTKVLEGSQSLQKEPDFQIGWSTGKGGWAYCPWLAIFHNKETHTIQRGVYCIYLFREDMKGFYLTLNQGVTSGLDHRAYGNDKYRLLHAQSEKIRHLVPELKKKGFSLDNSLDLNTRSKLAQSYSHSTIAYKYYDANSLPSDQELLKDLEAILNTYMTYLNQKK